MIYSILADLLVVVHLAFIIFVVLGAVLVITWRWVIYLHIPAVIWAALVEFEEWICPLTPWENQLRQAGGEAGYTGGFIEHYIIPVMYPENLTQEIQIILGVFVIVINVFLYGWILYHWRKKKYESRY